jgi:hypothetical protein
MGAYVCVWVSPPGKKRYSVTAAVIGCAAVDLGITVGCCGVSWL